MFLTSIIWKQVAEPWREAMVLAARKYSQIYKIYPVSIPFDTWRELVGRKTYAEPSLAVLGLNLVTVAEPVSVPAPESSRVVNANGVDALDLEAGALELVDNPAKRSGSVGAGEDVLGHEQTPDEILVLPGLSQTSVLQEEDTIVVEHVVNLLAETAEVADTNVLSHLEAGDLVVAAGGHGDVAVVHAQNLALLLGNANLAHSSVAPGRLVAAEGDTGDLGSVVLAGEAGQGTPAAADIQHLLICLQVNLLADDGQLVVLKLLERLVAKRVGDDTGGVDHAWAKEPAVKVVTAVVVVANLLLVCGIVSQRQSPENGVTTYPGNECA